MKKWLLILLLASILAIWPFFKKGFFESHDGEWMIIRFTAFHQTLSTGQFPVRFTDRLNNNYGYPVLNFLYPLPFYLAEIPKLYGFGFVESVKIIFALSTIASAFAMFWALSQVFARNASFAGSIVYLFSPYRFVDLYVRGSLGENLAFTILPLIAGSILKIISGKKIFLPILSISIGLLIIAHNVIAFIFLPFFIIFAILLAKKKSKEIVIAFLFGLLLSAFFSFPALYDIQYVKLSIIQVSEISDHLVPFSKIFIPSWGYGPNPNSPDGLSTQIGLIAIFILISSVVYTIFKGIKSNIINFQIIVFITIIFLISKAAQPVWQYIPIISVVQFPWRLLAVGVFISSYLTAFLITSSARFRILLVTLITASSIISTIIYTKPHTFTARVEGYYSTNEATTTVRDEYLPLWVHQKPQTRANEKFEIQSPAEIISQAILPSKYTAQISTPQTVNVQINTIFFPGWEVKANGQKLPINYQNQFGLINFELPKGDHQVIIKYTHSNFHLISELISLGAAILIATYFIILWRRQNS